MNSFHQFVTLDNEKGPPFFTHQCQSLLLRVGSYWKPDILALIYGPLCAGYFERKCLDTAGILVLHLVWLVFTQPPGIYASRRQIQQQLAAAEAIWPLGGESKGVYDMHKS